MDSDVANDASLERQTDGESASRTVLRAVASAKDVVPTDIDRNLYDVVDPDALNRLVGSGQHLEVRFTFAGCTVEVDGGGTVVVEPSAGLEH